MDVDWAMRAIGTAKNAGRRARTIRFIEEPPGILSSVPVT
jgi:hypothetical protein